MQEREIEKRPMTQVRETEERLPMHLREIEKMPMTRVRER